MLLKSPLLDVPHDDPFKNDVLNRKESAEVLTQLLSHMSQPIVLSIDAQWGAGKTTFIRMWSRYLELKGFTVLSFNAWKNDFCKDPLVALVAEIAEGVRKLKIDENGLENACKKLDAVLHAGAGIIKRSISSATAGVIDPDKIVEDAKNANSKPLNNEFDCYIDTKNAIKEFRVKLRKLFTALKSNNNEPQKPIVFVIDELDRCRPLFAIELLEIAKHLFDVEEITFVLAVDKEQLGHSIRSVYGQNMNVDGYLRRFVDIDYRLPQCDNVLFVKAQFNKYGFAKYFQGRTGSSARYDEEHLINVLVQLFTIFNVSLRTQEQCLTQLSIVLKTTHSEESMYPEFVALLIVLRSVKRDLYDDYINGGFSIDAIEKLLSSNMKGREFIQGNDWPVLMGYLICFCPNDILRKRKVEEYNSINSNDDTEKKPERDRAETIISVIGSRNTRHASWFTSTIVAKIEITQQFIAESGGN